MKILYLIVILIIGIILNSCNSPQSQMDKVSTMIEYAEQKDELSQEDIDELQIKIEELQNDLETNRKNYTDEQVKEIGKLQGRYVAILVKKGIDDFQESVKDFGNQMEGFKEGIKSATDNKSNENE